MSANDPGPLASKTIAGVDVATAAAYFDVDENTMRVFLIAHKYDIEMAAQEAVFERIEELGYLEGLFPLTVEQDS